MKQERKIPDNEVRLKALDMALRLRGSFAATDPKPAESTGVGVIVIGIPRPKRPVANRAIPRFPSPETCS